MISVLIAVLLAALGRTKESRQSLQRVFVSPDRNLSHAMARGALRELPTTARRHNGICERAVS